MNLHVYEKNIKPQYKGALVISSYYVVKGKIIYLNYVHVYKQQCRKSAYVNFKELFVKC